MKNERTPYTKRIENVLIFSTLLKYHISHITYIGDFVLKENCVLCFTGRIGVVGGCLEYTGAAYYAAISALKAVRSNIYVFVCLVLYNQI